MPFLLPPWKPRALFQRPDLPILLHQALLHLLPHPRLERGDGDMLDMPRVLIAHDAFFPLAQDRQQQGGDIRFVPELAQRREERFEVEDDRAGEGEPAEGLPVDA